MSLENFVPELWSANLLSHLDKSHVYAQAGIVNRDYEGELSGYGTTVNINQLGDVTIFDYTANTDMPEPEVLSGTQRQFVIDQQKGFNFLIDDIDDAQTRPKLMGEATQRAAYGLADTSDTFVASLYTGAGTQMTLDTGTAGNVYEALVDAGIALDENNVPRTGRWVVVPPWVYGYLLKDERFVDASRSGSTSALLNGQVGEAAGFTVLRSNNAPSAANPTAGTDYHILAGTSIAISYAEQIDETEAYRPERRFADALKGLHVYGGKVIRPEGLVAITATRA